MEPVDESILTKDQRQVRIGCHPGVRSLGKMIAMGRMMALLTWRVGPIGGRLVMGGVILTAPIVAM